MREGAETEAKEEPVLSGDERVRFSVERASQLYTESRYGEAIAMLSEAVDVCPSNHEAWNDLGVVLMAVDRYDEAEKCFDRALSLNRYYTESYVNKAELLRVQNRINEANTCLKQYLELHREREDELEGRVLVNLGWIALLRGNSQEAQDRFLQALERGRDNPQIYLDLRMAYLDLLKGPSLLTGQFVTKMKKIEEEMHLDAGVKE